MFRLQHRLPDDYSTARRRRVGQPRRRGHSRRLGKRLVILGHHYQREEVIQFGGRGVTRSGCPVSPRITAKPNSSSSAASTSWPSRPTSSQAAHQQVILPDLNAGCSMADMADLDAVEEVWEEFAEVIDVDADRAHHLHELRRLAEGLRGAQGRRRVHLLERPRGADLGARVGPEAPPASAAPWRARRVKKKVTTARRCSSSPTSISAATPDSSSASGRPTCGSWTRASASAACRTAR